MIDLPLEMQKEIVNTLVVEDSESRLLYLESINDESGEGTQNSSPKQKWDYKYNTIAKIAKKYSLKSLKITRGKLWEAIVVLGENDDLYVFFNKKNMESIIKKSKRNHYLTLLNLFNKKVDDMSPIQGEFPLFEEQDTDLEADKVLAEQMLETMEKKPEKVVVIAFENGSPPTVGAYIFNKRQQLVWQKNLTNLIEWDYQFTDVDSNINPPSRDSSVTINTKNEEKRMVKLKGS